MLTMLLTVTIEDETVASHMAGMWAVGNINTRGMSGAAKRVNSRMSKSVISVRTLMLNQVKP